jgi:putative sigma-54 modulation protein
MKLNIVYRHFKSTPAIKSKIKEKADHLKKYFKGKINVNWVCTIENDIHRSEVNVRAGHDLFHAKAEDTSLYKTMDEVLSKIERQVRKKDKKLKNKIHTPKVELNYSESF